MNPFILEINYFLGCGDGVTCLDMIMFLMKRHVISLCWHSSLRYSVCCCAWSQWWRIYSFLLIPELSMLKSVKDRPHHFPVKVELVTGRGGCWGHRTCSWERTFSSFKGYGILDCGIRHGCRNLTSWCLVPPSRRAQSVEISSFPDWMKDREHYIEDEEGPECFENILEK